MEPVNLPCNTEEMHLVNEQTPTADECYSTGRFVRISGALTCICAAGWRVRVVSAP